MCTRCRGKGRVSALLGPDNIECSRDCNASDPDMCHAKTAKTDRRTDRHTNTTNRRRKSTATGTAGWLEPESTICNSIEIPMPGLGMNPTEPTKCEISIDHDY